MTADPAAGRHVWVACPAGSVTGGPEALHQLCDALRRREIDARMVYFDRFDATEASRMRVRTLDRLGEHGEARRIQQSVVRVHGIQRADPYLGYDAPEAPIDAAGGLIVIPEVHPTALDLVPGAARVVWWLSVDNAWRNGAEMRDRNFEILGHAHQSDYARRFVELCGFGTSTPLSDYLNPEFLAPAERPDQLRDTVAYNPKKGASFTQAIIAARPDLSFTPIIDLDAHGVRSVLERSFAYIDFGSHPGRDRLPREAAAAGAPIVVARMGAAATRDDLPIPEEYKHVRALTEIPAIGRTLDRCRADPAGAHRAQADLVTKIGFEREVFDREVAAFAARYLGPPMHRLGTGRISSASVPLARRR